MKLSERTELGLPTGMAAEDGGAALRRSWGPEWETVATAEPQPSAPTRAAPVGATPTFIDGQRAIYQLGDPRLRIVGALTALVILVAPGFLFQERVAAIVTWIFFAIPLVGLGLAWQALTRPYRIIIDPEKNE